MQLPDHVTVPTCIGCGAMSQFGTCVQGCSEDKLELVRAVDLDTITALACDARVREDACRVVANDLVSSRPRAAECAGAYRRLQKAARRVLRDYPPIDERSPDQDQDAERATTWWCARCGGIDAPEPCLGICVWRRIDWVNAKLYEQQRDRALARHETELRLRLLLQRVASITPREGHWQHGWAVIQAEGRAALAQCADRASVY